MCGLSTGKQCKDKSGGAVKGYAQWLVSQEEGDGAAKDKAKKSYCITVGKQVAPKYTTVKRADIKTRLEKHNYKFEAKSIEEFMAKIPNKNATGGQDIIGLALSWPLAGKYSKDAKQAVVVNPDYVQQKFWTDDSKKAKYLADVVYRSYALVLLCDKTMKKEDGMKAIHFPKAVGKHGTIQGTLGAAGPGFQVSVPNAGGSNPDIGIEQTFYFRSYHACDAALQSGKNGTSTKGSIFQSASLFTMLFILIAGVFKEL